MTPEARSDIASDLLTCRAQVRRVIEKYRGKP